ncbi:MAG: PD-(D/E)XK nuclease family protein [Lachnospiraceae bacterium]|nr:PD-(D/E)XK nuclease family protein [Lachnospiraceae bacterium]
MMKHIYFQIHDDIKCLTRDNLESIKLDEMKNDYKYKGIVNEKALDMIDKEAIVSKNDKVKSSIVEGSSMSEEDIGNIIDEVNDNIKSNIDDIKSGKISASPYKKLSKSCDVCHYKAICKKSLHPDVVEDIDDINNSEATVEGMAENEKVNEA